MASYLDQLIANIQDLDASSIPAPETPPYDPKQGATLLGVCSDDLKRLYHLRLLTVQRLEEITRERRILMIQAEADPEAQVKLASTSLECRQLLHEGRLISALLALQTHHELAGNPTYHQGLTDVMVTGDWKMVAKPNTDDDDLASDLLAVLARYR